jgi:sugar O-acyltransferase (sialic acid O-acetyltransferase NeuD family)
MRVLIVGAGGHGQVIADILLNTKGKEKELMPIGFLDDNQALQGKDFLGIPVLGSLECCSSIEHDAIIIAIGNNSIRRCLFEKFQIKGERFIIAGHPSAIIASNVSVGAGTMICAAAVVNPSSTIGANVILNTGCTVDHHNRLGDHVHIAPGVTLGGEVTVGKGTLVGIGATIMPQCSIGEWSIIGAGALVNKNLPNRVLAAGVPAKIMRRLDEEYQT